MEEKLDEIEYLHYVYHFYGEGTSKEDTTVVEEDTVTGEKLLIPWDEISRTAGYIGKWIFRRVVEGLP